MREVIANRNFRRLWIAQIILTLGDALMQMGLLEVFRSHGYDERVETAKMFFAISLPGLALGPVAMAYLDRWQRRSVLMVSDAVRSVIVVGIALWLLPVLAGRLEQRDLLVVYALIGLIGAIATFYLPARSALVPNLIPVEQLVKGNTLFATSLAATTVGGRALGGFVAEVYGVKWAILANAVAYLLSVALLWQIRMDPHATTGHGVGATKPGGWRDFQTGMVYLWQHPVALPLVGLAGMFAFLLGVLMVAFVGYAMDTLGLRTGGVGYLIGAAGLGAGIGIVMVGRGKRWTAADWLPAAQLLVAASVLVLLSLTTNVWVAAGLVVVLGAIAATVMIQIDAKMQAQVADARRGAVFAARGMLTSATMLVAFWLQFGTAFFRRTQPPRILFWLGIGAAVMAGLTLVALRRRVSGRDCGG